MWGLFFTFYTFKKVWLLNKNKKSFKLVFWDLCNFFMTQVTQIILKNNKSIYIFGLSFLTLSAKDAKNKITSVSSILLSVYKKRKKQFYFRFFLFLILYKKRKKQFYFRFSVFSFLYKKRKKAILLPFFRFFVCEQKPKKAFIVQIFTSGISCFAEMEWEERKWRWEEWGWVEVRGGWGVGGGRRQRSVITTSFNKHNNNNFLKQLKTKTTATTEISWQRLKIIDNKIRKHRQLKFVVATSKNLRTTTTQVCKRHGKSLTHCNRRRKMSHVVAPTHCRCYPEGFYLNSQQRFWLQFYWFIMSLPRCSFHVIVSTSSCHTRTERQILTHSQSREMHKKRTYKQALEVKGNSVKAFNFYMSMDWHGWRWCTCKANEHERTAEETFSW